MDELLKILKALLPGYTDKIYKGIVSMLGLEDAVVVTSAEDADETQKSVTIAEIASKLRGLGYDVKLPGQEANTKSLSGKSPVPYNVNPVTPADDDNDSEDETEKVYRKSVDAFYVNRLGDRKAAIKSILDDVVGDDYRSTVYDQNIAFSKYIRRGEKGVDAKEMKLLSRQFFPEDAVMNAVLDEGYDVATIKATQIEAQGELGGIAVPPNRQSEITTRLPGLTAVRGSGANVITLVNSNSVEIPQWRGDSNRYIGLIRGQRGTETQSPTEQNFKLDMVPVVAYVYTFKVPLSQSLVEDAANLVTMLMNDIATTIAMDEDEEFLVGDGVNKAHGILPGGANVHGLREVVTGDADELTVAGIKALKRGVASQYRRNCVFIGNSDSYGIIESMTAGAGNSNWAFPDLSEEDKLLGRATYESEVMPDVAANSYPLIFGWTMGYDIVERLGMSIQRYQDSYTGINKVEYHVRKRFGGRLERPWMFALQKVAAGDPFSG